MLGETLGAYRIESELGSGGMGTVYRAEVMDSGRGLAAGDRVALKVVHPHLLSRRGFFKRFLREAEIGRQIDHENVVRTLDVDATLLGDTQVNFLVMEFVEGQSLRELLTSLTTVPEALLREIARQVTAGLSAVHEAGIVHRDLKPENVLITADDQVRIMDLGVARLVEESVALTQEGQFAGSLLYAAPEQFRMGPVGPPTDLYALGVMLYELATGENPYADDEMASVIGRHLNFTPPPVRDRNPDVSPFLSELISALVEKAPEARPGTLPTLALLTEGERSQWWAERERNLVAAIGHLPRIPVGRETRLLGREEELATVRRAWVRARGGEGSILLLEGETGIGKTRLMAEIVEGPAGEEAHVLYGSYPPSGGMGALSDAIVSKFGAAGLGESLGPHLSSTPTLAPAFAAMVRHEAAPAGSEPLAAEALHTVMVGIMRSLACELPVLWIVDDLQFAEPESRQMVLSMARAVEGLPVLLLLTAEPGLPVDELSHLSRLPNYTKMRLPRLGARHVIELLRDALGSEALAERLGGKIAYKSDGVPFFVFEILRGLKDGRFLARQPDGSYIETRVVEEIEVPSAVRDLVEERLRVVTDDDRNLLDVASVMGHEFDPDLISRVWELKRVVVLSRLAALERRAGVVRAAGSGYRFDHHQIRELVYGDLSESLRREYHALVAEALAEREGAKPGEASGDTAHRLARHHLRGSRPEDALPWIDPALDHLGRAFRNEAAIDLAALALGVAGLLRGVGRVDLLTRLYDRLDHVARYDEAGQALADLLEAARETGDHARLAGAERRRGHQLMRLSRYEDAAESFTSARRHAEEAGDREEESLAVGGLANTFANRYLYDDAFPLFERQLELTRLAGSRRAEMTARGSMAPLLRKSARYEEAETEVDLALEIAREIGDRRAEATCHLSLGNIHFEQGQVGRARDHYERCLEITREIGLRTTESAVTGNLGSTYRSLGRYQDAERSQRAALAISREMGFTRGIAINQTNIAQIRFLLGDLQGARELLLQSRPDSEMVGERHLSAYATVLSARISAALGETAEAERFFEEGIAVLKDIPIPADLSEALFAYGALLLDLGREDEARACLTEALSIGLDLGLPHTTVLANAALARLPGVDVEDALAALEKHGDEIEAAERMEARFHLWRATGEFPHLEEAHRLLDHLRDHAPEERRDAMVRKVPLHRGIGEAWETRDA